MKFIRKLVQNYRDNRMVAKCKRTNTLPDRLSDLLTVGLADLKHVETLPTHRVDMGEWILVVRDPSTDNDVCLVCLGGAALNQTLKMECAEGDAARYADALNALRTGEPLDAYMHIHKMTELDALDDHIVADLRSIERALPLYCSVLHDGPKNARWYTEMYTLRDDLRAKGY